ncbi:conjugal transfer protein TraG N-terminal domain-containing protein [Azospirillum sp. A29]|uniref:conjugal transfer protein TraG N-terminal domain-containing protein n=1 Tax=unclassified Azospirillum TaxID=2630922 RepID=UPI003670D87A
MWNINSIGDSGFLAEILNSIAMIVGTGEFYAVAQIGLLLGALLVSFQAIGGGARVIEWQKIFLGWVVFSLLFGPSTTVTITDSYKGEVRPVANVPIGVAAVGSTISEIGYQLTVLFEQGFSAPAMTGHGYGHAMEVLKKIRVTTGEPSMLGPANKLNGGNSDFVRSWTNYVSYCTTIGLGSETVSVRDIYDSRDIVNALKFDSRVWTVDLWIDASSPKTYDCTDAHVVLAAATRDFTQKYMRMVLPGILNVLEHDVPGTIGNALLAIGIDAISAEQYVTLSVLQPIFENGAVMRSEEDRAFTYAKFIEDAKNQRAVSWMGEASMFRSIVRPMLTFLEGFTYAVTPIMGFLVVIGPFGITVAGKYLLTLLWIQLWMPVLAIVNLYMHMSLAGRMAALDGAGYYIDSMSGLLVADGALQKWISTGEMLASSVPALTLMLVYGGSVAATHLAGRLQGGDFLKEDKVARDTFNAAPKYQVAPSYTVDPSRVTMASGADQMLTSFNVGSLAQSAESSTKSVADAKTQTFARNLASTVGTQAVEQYQHGHSELFKSGSAFQGSKSYELVSSSMRGVTDKYARGDESRTQLINAAAFEYGVTGEFSPKILKALGKAFGGGVGAAGGAKATDQMSGTAGQSAAAQIEAAIKLQYGRNDKLSGALTETALREAADTTQNGFTHSLSEGHQKTLSESAQQALSAQEAYQKADSLARSFGTSQTLSAGQAVNSINQQHGGRERLEAELERRNLTGARDALVRMDERTGGAITKAFGNREDAITYAGLMTLNNQNKMPGGSASSTAEAADRKAALLGLLSGATNHNSGPMGDPSRNAHLEGTAAGIPEPRAEVERVVGSKPVPAFGQVKDRVGQKTPEQIDQEGASGGRPQPRTEPQGTDGANPSPVISQTNSGGAPGMPTRADLEKRYNQTQDRHKKEANERELNKGVDGVYERTKERVHDNLAPAIERFNKSLVRDVYSITQHDPGRMTGFDVEPRSTQAPPANSTPAAPSSAPPLMQGNGHPPTDDAKAAPVPTQALPSTSAPAAPSSAPPLMQGGGYLPTDDVEAAAPPKQPSTGAGGSRPPGALAQGRGK